MIVMTVKEFKIQYALGSMSFAMIVKLAEDKNTPKEILAMLSTDKHDYVRYCAAGKPYYT